MTFNELNIGDFYLRDNDSTIWEVIPMMYNGCCNPLFNTKALHLNKYEYFGGQIIHPINREQIIQNTLHSSDINISYVEEKHNVDKKYTWAVFTIVVIINIVVYGYLWNLIRNL
jgi:hypothetical protein